MPGSLVVICTGWRCEEYVDRCLNSILDQEFNGDNHVLRYCIDEFCGGNLLASSVGNKKTFNDISNMSHLVRLGKLKNFISMINNVHPNLEDIICDVDLDDYLLPGALQTVLDAYEENPNLLLTYGSYCMESGRAARFNGEYKNSDFRGSKWLASHLKTFKYKLYREIKFRDLHGPGGNYFMTAADLAIMIPMLEMAGLDRIKHIKKCIYCYNDLNPLNDHKVHGEEQKRNERYIRNLPRRSRIEL